MGEKIRLIHAARRAGVKSKTMARWQDEGKLTDHRTAGGHRRVDSEELDKLLRKARKRK